MNVPRVRVYSPIRARAMGVSWPLPLGLGGDICCTIERIRAIIISAVGAGIRESSTRNREAVRFPLV